MDYRKMFYGASKNIFRNAFLLRNNETKAERLLWERLREKQLSGFRFKRQHPIEDYIADFYCHKAKLVIEIDGDYHEQKEQKFYDDLRTERLSQLGLTVIRFSNDEVLTDSENVLNKILRTIQPYSH